MDCCELVEICHCFMKRIGKTISVYNEASLQYELGRYIQDRIGCDYVVQFERNINAFGLKGGKQYYKKESDIVIFAKQKSYEVEPLESLQKEKDKLSKTTELYFIEVKFPRKKAYLRRMWSLLEDIAFCDQLFQEEKVKGRRCRKRSSVLFRYDCRRRTCRNYSCCSCSSRT